MSTSQHGFRPLSTRAGWAALLVAVAAVGCARDHDPPARTDEREGVTRATAEPTVTPRPERDIAGNRILRESDERVWTDRDPARDESDEDAAGKASSPPRDAVAVLHGTKHRPDVRGTVRMTENGDGEVKVEVTIEGLPPNTEHGFHIHEKGDCSADDAKSAGGHFAPDDSEHQLPPKSPRHAGDMGNIAADSSGKVKTTSTFDSFTLKDPESVIGRAVIVHAKADDGEGDSGHAGDRLACGVIGRGA